MFEMGSRICLASWVVIRCDGHCDRQSSDRGVPGNRDEGATCMSAEYICPGSRMERMLAVIWSKALAVGAVGIEDNFFDLGGNSMLSIQVSALISEAAGLEVPSAVLFEFPTIRKLAGFLEGRLHGRALMPAVRASELEADPGLIDQLVRDIRHRLETG
jgi:hypothetical protein